MPRDLPAGTVTFLFTDVDGSTRLLDELGAEDYAAALAEHRRIVRESCAERGGAEVDTQGDAFFFAFPTAPGALEASRAIVEGLSSGRVRVRVGLHTGTPLLTGGGLRRRRRSSRCSHRESQWPRGCRCKLGWPSARSARIARASPNREEST